jgi:MFS family permease
VRLAPTAAGIALGAAAGFNIANVGPAADVLADTYGVRLAAIGFLTTALFVTHLAMQIPGGRLVDRRGAWTLGVWALVAVVAGNVIALLAPSFALGIAGRLVAGLGTGAGFVAGSDYVRATVGTPTAQGLYGASGVGGGGLALAVVPLAVPGLDWRAPYVTALVFALIVLAALPLAPRDTRRGAVERGRISDVVHDRRLYPLAVAHSASFGLSVIAGNWAVSLLRDDGYTRGVAGAVAALTLLSGLVTRPLGGRLIERAPGRAAWLFGTSMLACAAGTVLLLLNLPLGLRVVGAAVLGLAAGIPFAAAFTGAQLLQPDDPGAAVGFVNSCATFVILVGTPLVGLTFALPGQGRAGFAAIAIAFVLAYLPVRRAALPEPA